MATYRILLKASVRKDLRDIAREDVVRILDRIAALAENPRPHGCEKLSAQERYRVRQGQYRIVYAIKGDVLEVWVVRIGHRRDVYRQE